VYCTLNSVWIALYFSNCDLSLNTILWLILWSHSKLHLYLLLWPWLKLHFVSCTMTWVKTASWVLLWHLHLHLNQIQPNWWWRHFVPSKCSTTTRCRDSKENQQLNCISYLILWPQYKFHLVSCAVALVQTASCTFSSDLNLNCILYLTNDFSQNYMLYLILWPQFILFLVSLYSDLSLKFILFSILSPQSRLYPMTPMDQEIAK